MDVLGAQKPGDEGNKNKNKGKTPTKPKRYFAVSTGAPSEQSNNESLKQKHKGTKSKRHIADPGGKVKVFDLSSSKKMFQQQKREHYRMKAHHKEVEEDYRKKVDPFPGEAAIPADRLKKYQRGKLTTTKWARSKLAMGEIRKREKKMKAAVKQAARSEYLLTEEAGYLEGDDGTHTTNISQGDIVEAVDITSAQKHFELRLNEFGPYRAQYTRNGRFMLMGGAKGHIAAIDWLTKKLLCEINVMETIHDIQWLHQETMYAVAQKQWTYIYDNQGIELHCLKMVDSALRLEFLPFHFLLASSSSKGYLSWIDVSIGEKVAGHATGLGRLDVMCQNPNNATLCLGHSGGTVTMWSPNVKEPLVKMLCHRHGVRSIAVDPQGKYIATSGIDRKLKIWDIRNYKMLQSYQIGIGASSLAFSQRDMLAVSKGNIVEVYKDCCRQTVTSPYMSHRLPGSVLNVQFCPYEDVLGVGHERGFESLLIPGAGEPNFDALEANPFQSKKQRRQAEVKMLLDKIPADMIHLNDRIGEIDIKTFKQRIELTNSIKTLKPELMDYTPKYKMKGKNKGRKREQRKKGVVEEDQRKAVRREMKKKSDTARGNQHNQHRDSGNVLNRFERTQS
ncbi:WD repeat-containing protein 46-like isoform X2 [Mizuhopecten yessoensis]|uniref:WD repeat-containing protein 46 n=1 Tax=Mizuhopecten yessoensis TaxID=6573 RepID=A0A210PLR3_MIZYE|nr:WD repeat-containing protein 46-like isoform X2 [Mizuhopecten yessoensis]OWF37440.1 WD repeat-containing protein 46 [Mizuhopecten yessoensis]